MAKLNLKEIEKECVGNYSFGHDMKKFIQAMRETRTALKLAKQKLILFRKHSDGEYKGGMEHTSLIQAIEQALNLVEDSDVIKLEGN